jgi:hypothetical protein
MTDEDLLLYLLIPVVMSGWTGSGIDAWENFLRLFER